MAGFARRTRVRARRRTRQYVEHPGRVQRGETSQIRVRSRESVNFSHYPDCSEGAPSSASALARAASTASGSRGSSSSA